MQEPYRTTRKNYIQALARFLTKNGQVLLPMVELIEQSKLAMAELIGERTERRIQRRVSE